ncbi:cupin [Pseudonocardia sp. EC080610-09]|uniref:cupin domain-containing protein n=1 Tax=unclassified Pseudonocardia TaxID=2619320 RepID=UPI0006CB2DD8|nr:MULTISPECIES: cupin domain-containing protein [unclassified Pseudonocardia]ALE74584.1 cupin [Pseudonocardia sp. EC080625-04]ALL78006.1 cupin [Pseudonocardia sp. EC080610-09]
MSRPDLAAALDLAPHPEGGWYRRTWTSPASVPTPHGGRPTATAILYLMDGPGRWHRVRSTELWLWHSGSAAELVLGGDGDAPGTEQVLRLGAADPETLPQREVPAGVWQRAYPLGDEPVLVSCVVSPGFDFADFELR